MEIVWDERKRLANLTKHGLDFADLTLEFFTTAVLRPAKQGRLKAMGRFADGSIAVVFVALGTQGLSVISMRPASLEERKLMR